MAIEKKLPPEPKVTEIAEQNDSSMYCLAAKQIVAQHLTDLTFSEAFHKIKTVETILETIEKCGISTIDLALQCVRIAGSVAAYQCRE